MKKLYSIFLFTTVTVTGAFSQTDVTYTATLKKMLEVAGTEASFHAAIKQMLTMFKQQKPEVPDAIWASVEQEFNNTSMEELVDMLAPVYQKHMTEDDLKKIIEFYETPVGKKFAAKTPLIMEESMQIGQLWGIKVGQRLQEKMKEKGY